MKKMVPHDLMRVQITKISVYLFFPAVIFFTRPDPKCESSVGLARGFYSLDVSHAVGGERRAEPGGCPFDSMGSQ